MLGAVAHLGTLAFERTRLAELTDTACASAAEALGSPVRVDERLTLLAERDVTRPRATS